MKWLLLILLGLTLLFIGLFYVKLRYIIRQRRRRAMGKSFRITRSVVALVIVLGILASVSGVGLTAGCIYYRQGDNSADSTQTVASADPEDSEPVLGLPTSTPVRTRQDIFPVFHLSEVKNSTMLALADTLILGNTINADLLSTVDEWVDTFLAQHSHPVAFFPFYPNLAAYFPIGEAVAYTFDDVSSLEECNAQLRGVGEKLKNHLESGRFDLAAPNFHHLAIRAIDALYFTISKNSESEEGQAIWVYAELSFAALINEYICNQPQGLARSDWYYRLAQVYDYLGWIADTDELQLKMYFLSAVFLRRAFEILEEQGIQIYPNAYDHEIWDLCVEMLYRVAIRVEPSDCAGFYQEIQQVENTVFAQSLPADTVAETARILKALECYQDWRD